MGQLGTVGAMARDDFLLKMKEVFREIVASQTSSAEPVLPLVELPSAPVPSGQSVTRVSESLDLACSVPTEFGDGDRKRKINTLKHAYFVSSVVSLFVGLPRHKRVVEGYAWCLLHA